MQAIITVDVEAHRGNTPVETFIWGKAIDGKRYGLELIVDTLVSYGLKGLFFVDFAEINDYGEEAITEVVQYLKSKNQYIGIHLHPDHFGDTSRTFMWEYSFEEQNAMVEFCVNHYKKLVGIQPLFFRAGKFGANDDTLRVLCQNNIKYDSSCFYKHNWCKISNQSPSNNAYKIMNDLIEIPVSVFKSMNFFDKTFRIDQFDLSNSPTEMRHCIEQQKNIDDKAIITLFFHSFSFFPYRNNPERVRFNRQIFCRFNENLGFIKNSSIHVIEDIYNPQIIPIDSNQYRDTEKMPSSGNFLMQIVFLFDRARLIFHSNIKARALLIGTMIIVVVFLIMLINLFM